MMVRPHRRTESSHIRRLNSLRASFGLYVHTLRYLKFSQVWSRIRRRFAGIKVKMYRFREADMSVRIFLCELEGDPCWRRRFDEEAVINGRLCLLYQTFRFPAEGWKEERGPHLWNFNLHYFEYAIPLALKYQEEKKRTYREYVLSLVKEWIKKVKSGDGWHPYTISLRLINWKLLYEILDEQPEAVVADSMYSQYRHLIKTQETHLLGNHYFENLKTLVIFSLYFKEMDRFRTFFQRFQREIWEQILPDGLHFERSLMYHKLILEGILRVREALQGRHMAEEQRFLDETLSRMGGALYSLERGMGRTPLFNDAGDNVAKTANALLAVLRREGIRFEQSDAFASGGYYKAYAGAASLMLDCGKMGPDYLTGHGHCDALSFELSLDAEPVLVNSGTYQYQDRLRPFFRSTRAHNTVEIAGREQSEIWGEHRTGRRLQNMACVRADCGWIGSYETYEGYRHQRLLRMKETEKGIELVIRDVVHGPAGKTASAFFHLAPGFSWEMRDGGWGIVKRRGNADEERAEIVGITDIKTGVPKPDDAQPGAAKGNVKTSESKGNAEVIIHRNGDLCSYAPEFGKRMLKQVMEIRFMLDNGTGVCVVKMAFCRRKQK